MPKEDYLTSFVNNCTSWYTFDSKVLYGLRPLVSDIVVFESRQSLSIDEINLFGSFRINTQANATHLVAPLIDIFSDHLLNFGHLSFAVVTPRRIEHNQDHLTIFMDNVGHPVFKHVAYTFDDSNWISHSCVA